MSAVSDLHRPFVRAAMDAPYLARDEERALALAWRDHGDRAALDKIVRAHLRLVIAVASRFRNYGLALPDLIQEGTIGLMQAAERFDLDREVRFSTYAGWWIRAAIQDFVLKNWSIVRGGTSSGQKALFFNLRRLRAEIERRSAEGEVIDARREIATRLNVSEKDVDMMDLRLSGADLSLDATATDTEGDGMPARLASLPSEGPLPDEITALTIDGTRREAWLREALALLSDRERDVVHARRLAEPSATLEALGVRLGVSKERVRQIEARALEKLRAILAHRAPAIASA